MILDFNEEKSALDNNKLSAEIIEVENQNETLIGKIKYADFEKLEEEKSELSKEIASLKSELEEKEKNIIKFQETIKEFDNYNMDIKKEKEYLLLNIKNLENQLKKTEDENSDLKAEIRSDQEIKSKYEDQFSELDKTINENSNLLDLTAQLKNEIQMHCNEIEEKEKNICDHKIEILKLKEEKETLISESKQNEEKLITLKNEVEKMTEIMKFLKIDCMEDAINFQKAIDYNTEQIKSLEISIEDMRLTSISIDTKVELETELNSLKQKLQEQIEKADSFESSYAALIETREEEAKTTLEVVTMLNEEKIKAQNDLEALLNSNELMKMKGILIH
jgi:chromosome segregation ATPase